jgi:hypothetical protein
MISDAQHAEEITTVGDADLVLIDANVSANLTGG